MSLLRLGATVVVALVGAAALGRLVLPSWVEPLVAAPDPRVSAALDVPRRWHPDTSAPPLEVRETEVTVPRTGARARIVEPVAPASAAGRPAAVVVGGSGPSEVEATLPWARALASRGVVALSYDKRTHGYGPMLRDYDELADDGLAAITFFLDAERLFPLFGLPAALDARDGSSNPPMSSGRACGPTT